MKEIFVTRSAEKADELSKKLQRAGIQCVIRLLDSTSAGLFSASSRRSRGMFAERGDLTKYYHVYVKRKDFTNASEMV